MAASAIKKVLPRETQFRIHDENSLKLLLYGEKNMPYHAKTFLNSVINYILSIKRFGNPLIF